MLALLVSTALVLSPLLLRAGPALALSDVQELVVASWSLVNQSFVDPSRFDQVRWRRLRQKALERPILSSEDAYAAIESMLEPLGDPYTRLLRPADFATLRSNTEGTVTGVGLQLALADEEGSIVVVAPLEGSPAQRAGISSGSQVLAIEGQAASDLGLEATAAALRGPEGSEVHLSLVSPEGLLRDVTLERQRVDLQPVRSRLLEEGAHRLGYLRLSQFSETVPGSFQAAIEALEAAGMEGLILDLRNNSGGLVSAGLAVANGLLDNQPIVETMDRDGLGMPQQAGPGQLFGGPMLTLVNGGTASASEILAGALQDDGRSELLGSRTFGKGLIQTLIPLGDGSGLAVTVARYQTPSGRDIQNLGIEPDRPLAKPEPLNPGAPGDTWLEEAERLLIQRLGSAAGQP
ncbi:carboxyl-terminal processing protease CtpZ [Cyanobium sp. ATX 6F1]|uniref:carboxyl-terminal processing protease CtpZ n=1 Tax=unclassified Cyanobium TaxID=2627006 RepID=UPI00396564EC